MEKAIEKAPKRQGITEGATGDLVRIAVVIMAWRGVVVGWRGREVEVSINTPCQHTLSYQHTMSTHPINTPCQHTLSYQHTLSTHPINTPCQHILSTHPFFSLTLTHLLSAANILSPFISTLLNPINISYQYTL